MVVAAKIAAVIFLLKNDLALARTGCANRGCFRFALHNQRAVEICGPELSEFLDMLLNRLIDPVETQVIFLDVNFIEQPFFENLVSIRINLAFEH